MLQFDLNVSILLREYPFLERFDRAAQLGFGAIEFWWPHGEQIDAIVQRIRDAHVEVALFNFDAGNMAAGDRGLLNDPQREAQFRANVPLALEFAQRIGCTKLNALAGKWRVGDDRQSQLARVGDHLQWAAEQAQAAGITILVESLNAWENGGYLFTNTPDTLHFLESVEAPNLKYQYDIYHMQRMEGNIIATLQQHMGQIGHIQVADAPARHQPGTGELNYRTILEAIDESSYAGMIGLEYNPLGSSEQSFAWLPHERRGGVPVEALRLGS
jgi:hydroxypyruvate isomerase